MWLDRVSNTGPLTYQSEALPTALRGPAFHSCVLAHRVGHNERLMNQTSSSCGQTRNSKALEQMDKWSA